jgi:hypothetical protein
MKLSVNIFSKKALLFCFLMLSLTLSAQQFTLTLANQTSTSNTFDFDLMLTVPSGGRRVHSVSAGINFDAAILNGGTPAIVASNLGAASFLLVPGSIAPELQANGGLNSITTTYRGPGTPHLRIVQVTKATSLVDLAAGTYRVGTFRFTNTTTWTANSNAQLWISPSGTIPTGGSTNAIVGNQVFGSATAPVSQATTTTPALILFHTTTNKYSVPLNAAPTCPTSATASSLAAESPCAGAANGSALITLTGAPSATSAVTYSVDGGATQNATLSSSVFTVSGLSAGSHVVAVTYPNCTAVSTSSFTIGAGDPATTIGTESLTVCGTSYTWPTSGATYNVSGVYPFVSGCNTATLTLTLTPAPAQPTLACYQTATFNTATCSWDITGTQPAEPTTTLACYQTRTFNGAVGVCAWEVSGTQPVEPTTALACYQTRTFNGAVGVCAWEVSGTQPAEPTTALACYQTRTFNGAVGVCAWEVSGTQPAQPTTACYQTATFNGCTWDLTGTQQTNTIPVTAVGTYTWANNGQAYSASGTYTGNVVNCVIQVLDLTITPVQSGVLSLKVYLEGYYLSGGQMRSALANSGIGTNNAISDTIKVQLRSQTSPNASDLSTNVLLSTNGTASISIPPSLIGGNYYIAVYHRNSLETWSSSAIAITDTTNFDFTTSSSQAYGAASMKQVEAGVWALYSGDHNQDGSITSSDLGSVATEASLFSFGYIKTDLTGDGAIDGFDLGLADNNSNPSLVSSHP